MKLNQLVGWKTAPSVKLREVSYRGGFHDMTISTGGVQVFPRLVAAEHHEAFAEERVSSGVPQLDQLLGGGLDRGTSVLLLGPAGSGKSALSHQYAIQEAKRGGKSVVYTFDEGIGTVFARARSLGLDLETAVKSGMIRIQQIDPAELSPGEFSQQVRDEVEKNGARTILIDSVNGYLHAIPQSDAPLARMHELLSYLNERGVATLLVLAQHGIVGTTMTTPLDVSYLADTVLVLRFFESQGRVRRAISAGSGRRASRSASSSFSRSMRNSRVLTST